MRRALRRPASDRRRVRVAILSAALLCAAASAHAQSSWTAFNTGSVPGGPITGTLLGASVTVTSNYPSGSPAVGDNLIGQSSAPMWSPSYAPFPTTPAGIYPAGAVNASTQLVVQVGFASPAGSTAANPGQTTVRFSSPVVNPTVLFYSVDSATLNFAGSTDWTGTPVTPAITTNSGAAVSGTQVSANGIGAPTTEGCFANSRRACGVVQYTGIFTSLQFNHFGPFQDGVGFQIGSDALSALAAPPPTPVPTLPGIGLAALALALAAASARRLRRRA